MSKKLIISIIILFIFHFVGIIGMMSDHPAFFIRNTPINLILSALILLINHKKWSISQVLGLFLVFSGGFLVEVIGANTGLLFGNYYYGKTLGMKLFNVPVVIAFNWMLLIYITGNLLEGLRIKIYLKAALGACLLVGLDCFIEPIAIHFDYWQWENNMIPLTNYLCWFIISFLFLSLLSKIGFRNYNPISGVLLFLQLFMFITLNLTVV